MAKATLLLDYKARQGEPMVEMVLWRLPRATRDRPYGIKYRLYLGRAGRTVVRFDNERGKGSHGHVGAEEIQRLYSFHSVDRLLSDFRGECERSGWRWDE